MRVIYRDRTEVKDTVTVVDRLRLLLMDAKGNINRSVDVVYLSAIESEEFRGILADEKPNGFTPVNDGLVLFYGLPILLESVW